MKRANPWKITRTAGCLTLAVLMTCLGQATAAVSPKAKATPAKPVAEKYAVLNPRADLPPIDAKALAPRLASLEGKTVYVHGAEGNMNAGLEIMLMIARGLAQKVPGIKVVYLSDRYGDATADSVVPAVRIVRNPTDAHSRNTAKEAEKADAVVTGLGY
jgi:hypothetical protein